MAEDTQDQARQRQILRLKLEQERRKRAMQDSPDIDPKGFMERAKDAYYGAGDLAREINTGLVSWIPGARDLLADFGGITRPSGEQPEGAAAGAARMVGEAAPLVMAAPAAGARFAGSLGQQGVLKRILGNIAEFATRRPGTYFGGETAAAAGAGAAGEMAEEAGASPGERFGAELLGGAAGGFTTAVPSGGRRIMEGLRANLAPMTEQGGRIRAGRQMQRRAGGPEQAERYAQELENLPEGVTPAQWIGDERLMAQEARLLEDNPQLSNQIKADLQEARIVAQESLLDAAGRQRSRQDWELAVLNRVTPEGAAIEPGQTDVMLDQAFESFRPLYDRAKGFDIQIPNFRQSLNEAVNTEQIIAEPPTRESVERFVNNQVEAFSERLATGTAQSDDLLELRSRIRTQRRKQMKNQNYERADLLGAAEDEITNILNNNLPEEVIDLLQQTDSQYRTYKVVEDAIFSAGDETFTPQQLSQAIRRGGLTTESRYARGADETTQELRQLALSGRNTEELLGDPRRAEQMIRGLPDDAKLAVQSDFLNTLYTRAANSAQDATEAGVPLISGRRLIQDVEANRDVMRSLGMNDADIKRVDDIAQRIQRMERRSPAAVEDLFEDGPASLMQLAAALAGAKSGQNLAGGGLGSSMVMAQYMSNKARGTLARLTSDEATRLLQDATTDPKLYNSLLTKGTVPQEELKSSAQYLEGWLLANAAREAGVSDLEDER